MEVPRDAELPVSSGVACAPELSNTSGLSGAQPGSWPCTPITRCLT